MADRKTIFFGVFQHYIPILLDALIGWVACDGGIILQTSNGINYFPQRAYGDGVTLNEIFAYNVSLISIDGKSHGILYDGDINQGLNTIALNKKMRRGVYVLLIQTKTARDSLKKVF